MRSGHTYLAMCFVAALAAAGCQSDQGPERMTETPGQLLSDSEHAMSGELHTVDLDAKTFTLASDGRPEAFTFTDATEVTGAAGPQGLAGREGARATVHYREEESARIATRIVLE